MGLPISGLGNDMPFLPHALFGREDENNVFGEKEREKERERGGERERERVDLQSPSISIPVLGGGGLESAVNNLACPGRALHRPPNPSSAFFHLIRTHASPLQQVTVKRVMEWLRSLSED